MTTKRPDDETLKLSDPPVLVALLIGARRSGDRTAEAVVRRELDRLGIRISFAREPSPLPRSMGN